MAATSYEILTFIGGGVSARDYHRLKAALDRLQSTTVATSLRQASERRMHRFSWINEWTERADAHGRADGIGAQAGVACLNDLAGDPDQDVGVPDGRHAMLRHGFDADGDVVQPVVGQRPCDECCIGMSVPRIGGRLCSAPRRADKGSHGPGTASFYG
jgi:Replication initiator protein A